MTDPPPLVLRAAHLVDPAAAEPLHDAAILVVAGKIRAVGPARDMPAEGTDRIDLGGRTLLPGLIDAHVHLVGLRDYHGIQYAPREGAHDLSVLRAAQDCARLLRAGFTTVRDVGSAIAPALRDAINDTTIPGPTIHAAGPIICQTGGHADNPALPLQEAAARRDVIIADSPDQCRHAVRQAVRAGADLIKICTTGGIGSAADHPGHAHFTTDEVAALVDEAHRLGKRIAAHAQGRDGILNAVRAGVDTIEHGYWLDEQCAEEMLARDTVLVPTIALFNAFANARSQPRDMPPWRLRKQQEALKAMLTAFRLACSSGLTIAAGTDYFGTPDRAHGNNADELITMVELGMTPLEAIRAATIGSATAIGVQGTVATLQPGMRADIIAVDGNPIHDIHTLRRVAFVMSGGRIQHQPNAEPSPG